jgi:hypothetical protein
MKIRFETSDREMALKFLQKFYPSKKIEDTENSAKDILDFVEKDIIRIPNPDFHSGGQVFPSKNWSEEYKNDVLKAFEKL